MNYLCNILLFFLFVFSLMVSCDNGTTDDRIIDYSDWGRISFSEYNMCNSIWNKGEIVNYSQFVYITRGSNFPVGWEYTWPSGIEEGDVKTYPNIQFGWNPWDGSTTTGDLSAAIGDINGFTVTFDLDTTVQPGTKYNLSFDIWITEHDYVTNPPTDNITREIMIWLDYSPDVVFPGPTPVTIDGDNYLFVRYPNVTTDDYTRDYIAFLKDPPDAPGTHSRTYNIKAFFDYLLGETFITNEEYMTIIHLGNEVWYGSGEVLIRNYAADVW
jgi:hypothetical protein